MKDLSKITHPLIPNEKTHSRYGFITNHEFLLSEKKRIPHRTRIATDHRGREYLEYTSFRPEPIKLSDIDPRKRKKRKTKSKTTEKEVYKKRNFLLEVLNYGTL